jgi:hypothetical protein
MSIPRSGPAPTVDHLAVQDRNPGHLHGLAHRALGDLESAATYHAFAFEKHGQRYLGQIQYLFNRRYNLRTILLRLVRDAAQAAPRTLKTSRVAEASC